MCSFNRFVKSLVVFSSVFVVYMVFVSMKFRGAKETVMVNVLPAQDAGDIPCMRTKTLPPFTACLLPVEMSKVSTNLTNTGKWEEYLVKFMQRGLVAYPQATLIDVGANLGFFTMLAATMGHPVVAVEPIAETIRRLQKSVAVDGLTSKVTILNNAISGRRTYFSMGGADPRADYVQVLKEVAPMGQESVKVAPAIFMDDLLRFISTDVAILKIDIEGYECQAMKKMSSLLQNVFVPYIFMEWLWIFRNQNQPNTWCSSTELRALVAQLLDAGYVPFDAKRRTTGRLDPDTITTTWDVKDMGWRHKSAPHLVF